MTPEQMVAYIYSGCLVGSFATVRGLWILLMDGPKRVMGWVLLAMGAFNLITAGLLLLKLAS